MPHTSTVALKPQLHEVYGPAELFLHFVQPDQTLKLIERPRPIDLCRLR
jgi:hypothetical protein